MTKRKYPYNLVPTMPWIIVVDKDTVETDVDGETMVFHRSDVYGGHPLSGLASFGSVQGDHRMIRVIADDIQEAFRRI